MVVVLESGGRGDLGDGGKVDDVSTVSSSSSAPTPLFTVERVESMECSTLGTVESVCWTWSVIVGEMFAKVVTLVVGVGVGVCVED